MDDFMVYGSTFDECLHNLGLIMKRCVETNIVLNYEQRHFMASHEIVLGHLVSSNDIEVDKAKIDVVYNLTYPTCTKEVRFFLSSAGFHRCFTK